MSQDAITRSARGEKCQIRIPHVCSHDPEKTVWCHLSGSAAGKGIGMKAHSILGAYGCFECHNVVDRRVPTPRGMTRQDVESAFADGHYRSLVILKEKGLI
jgi:hypothetical protein